ncbi:hypothetical protein [Cryobacterium sp. Y11]|nr:hypothetical protein [Cryobacterium sp. Y11]
MHSRFAAAAMRCMLGVRGLGVWFCRLARAGLRIAVLSGVIEELIHGTV